MKSPSPWRAETGCESWMSAQIRRGLPPGLTDSKWAFGASPLERDSLARSGMTIMSLEPSSLPTASRSPLPVRVGLSVFSTVAMATSSSPSTLPYPDSLQSFRLRGQATASESSPHPRTRKSGRSACPLGPSSPNWKSPVLFTPSLWPPIANSLPPSQISFLDASTLTRTGPHVIRDDVSIRSIAISQDNSYLATGQFDGKIIIRNLSMILPDFYGPFQVSICAFIVPACWTSPT